MLVEKLVIHAFYKILFYTYNNWYKLVCSIPIKNYKPKLQKIATLNTTQKRHCNENNKFIILILSIFNSSFE